MLNLSRNINKQAKIVATLGPASYSYEIIKELVLSGMDVARLNFSHGDYAFHKQNMETIRKVSAELNRPIAILQDLQGPKIRTGKMTNDGVEIITGEELIITTNDILGTSSVISTIYTNLIHDVDSGDVILIDDGKISLKVKSVNKDKQEILCEIIFGGIVKNNKGINLPGQKLSVPALTEKDKEDLQFGLANDVDYIALSFVREASDVEELRALIEKTVSDRYIPIIAKIEKPQALDNIDGILEASDGIMVARGDLGVELDLARVPVAQKDLIKRANAKKKLVITATQMLESMVSSPSPTRAEASDVANAIFDGTDAVMLSGETASGDFPVQTVKTMSRIITEAESIIQHDSPAFVRNYTSFTDTISDMACQAANRVNAKAVIVLTNTGRLARKISKGRTNCPIIALSPNQTTCQYAALYWGIQPYSIAMEKLNPLNRIEDITDVIESNLLEHGIVSQHDVVVIATSIDLKDGLGHTDIVKLHKVVGK